MQLLRFVIW